MTTIYDWMKQNLPERPFILEIGAHHAEDSERFFGMWPEATIVAFEPDPRNIPVIREKRLEALHDFLLVEAAVGAENGVTNLHLSGGTPPTATGEDRNREWTYSSSIRRPKRHLTAHPTVKFVGTAPVHVKRLDSIMWHWHDRKIDFIWSDVQGAEGDLIVGAPQTLARTRYFYTEFDEREMYEGQIGLAEIQEMLPPVFEMVGIFDANNVLFRNTRCAG